MFIPKEYRSTSIFLQTRNMIQMGVGIFAMYMLMVVLFFLSFLGMVGVVTCLILSKKNRLKGYSPEDEIVRAIGLRGIVSSVETTSDYREQAKLKLSTAHNPSFALSPKLRGVTKEKQKTIEFIRITEDAVKEVLGTIRQLAFELKDSLKNYEAIFPEEYYSSSKNVSSDLNLARHLLSELVRRKDFIENEADLASPNYEKVFASATEVFFLSRDSVNTLISNKDREPIHWTKINNAVKDIIVRLEKSMAENRMQRRSRSGQWD